MNGAIIAHFFFLNVATFFLSSIFYIIHSRSSLFLHIYQAQKCNIFESRRHVFFLFGLKNKNIAYFSDEPQQHYRPSL